MLKNSSENEDPKSINLGDALRSRRKDLDLTMQNVADSAGLSVGFISQVERGITSPSLSSLASLAKVLQTEISNFLQTPLTAGQTTRKRNRPANSVADAKVSYERLSTTFPGSKVHSVIVHEPPGHRIEPMSHYGEEMFYIIDGEITVEIEGGIEILTKGDSIHFDSQRVHSIWNHTATATSLLWCGTKDIFGEAPAPIHKETAAEPITKNSTEDSDQR